MAPVASLIFVITIITSLYAFSNETIYRRFMLHPYKVSRNMETYTLFTSGLIHRDYVHLMFNMLSYYFFAFGLETILGHWQFGLLYVISLILSDIPTVFRYRNQYQYHSLGASGAISAVVFSFIMFSPKSGMGLLFLPGIDIPAYIFGLLYLAYCTYASKYSRDTINHDAHLYGALCGIVLTIILSPSVVPQFLASFGIYI